MNMSGSALAVWILFLLAVAAAALIIIHAGRKQ
jgi:hypothetical protein